MSTIGLSQSAPPTGPSPQKKASSSRTPRRFPPCHAQPGAKPKEWLNQRELGRVFGLTGAEMGRRLTELGWRDKERGPAAACLDDGRARTVAKGYARQSRASAPIAHQWHMARCEPGLKASGLEALDAESVFVQVVADQALVALKFLGAPIRGKRTNGMSRTWPETLQASSWWVERLNNHLAHLPEQRRIPFALALKAALERKGVASTDVEQLLAVAGHLPAIRAHTLGAACALAVPGGTRPRL